MTRATSRLSIVCEFETLSITNLKYYNEDAE
jgi:hypothetical protein